jgi:hypothetical protein
MATVIEILPLGNLANRMIQFLAAWKLQQELGDAEVRDPHLPEWGLCERAVDPTFEAATLVVDRLSAMPFPSLCLLARRGNYGRILIDNYMQRMECLPDRFVASSLFSSDGHSYDPRDDELLINIRSGELVGGFRHYPLVPAEFYDRILEISGLKPVFMGQIEQNAYCTQLRKRFPHAKFLESQGVIQDFQTVRKGRHIVTSVSTFSWLAAWLSDAKQIYLPMLGILNPMHFIGGQRNIDLLPSEDARYRFFLFPLHFGLPEGQSLTCHSALSKYCKEISPRQVHFLRTHTPILSKIANPVIDFDDAWYVHEYIQAAAEISDGWFAGPLEHYAEIGMRRGYQPVPVGFSVSLSTIDSSLDDLSLHKRATQSSLCQYSLGATVEEDASRAVSGGAQTPYAFHTNCEANPWWSVDLGNVCLVRQVVVVNRFDGDSVVARAAPLFASASLDGCVWSPLFTTPDGLIPGIDGKPLVWTAAQPVYARFVRLMVARTSCLHLRQVRVLGAPC